MCGCYTHSHAYYYTCSPQKLCYKTATKQNNKKKGGHEQENIFFFLDKTNVNRKYEHPLRHAIKDSRKKHTYTEKKTRQSGKHSRIHYIGLHMP